MGKLAKTVGLNACSLLARLRAVKGIPILTYHSIDDSGSYPSTSPRLFEVEMTCLARLGCVGLSVARLMTLLIRGEIPPRSVGLTFDDGLQSFMDSAWPVLKRLGFSATVFVPVDFVGGATTWFANHGLRPMPVLSWDNLRRLRDESVDIQSHGCSHRRLTGLAEPDMLADLQRSKATLREELNTDIDHVCYPYGDFNDAVKTAANACGYQSALTTLPGRYRIDDDPYAIRREDLDYVNITDTETAELVIGACVEGSYSLYIKAKLALHRLIGLRDPGSEPR
jgi:peptidoglycan/xylan/chitin deacetylase (PgdA/CDA1 family)